MKPADIDTIIIHCSASRTGVDLRAVDIDRMHRHERGFKCIGYHFVVDLDGTVEKGRDLSMSGAHCNEKDENGKSYNSHSIGICYVGGLDENGKPADTRTDAQKEAMNTLVWRLFDKYPIKEIIGHRDTSPDKNNNGIIEKWEWVKSCPCFDVKAEFPIAVCTAKRK